MPRSWATPLRFGLVLVGIGASSAACNAILGTGAPLPREDDAGSDVDTDAREDGGRDDAAVLEAGVDAGHPRVVLVGAGISHHCAAFDDGRIKCWGGNGQGELGLGDSNDRGDEPNEMGSLLPFVDLGPDKRVTGLALGSGFSCATFSDETGKCWGKNDVGQLGAGVETDSRGDNTGEMGASLKALFGASNKRVLQIAVGTLHGCARFDDGLVSCWGKNTDGQLGNGDVVDRPSASGTRLVRLGTNRKAVDLGAGAFHTCVRLDDDSVKCWGNNAFGQLGLGMTQPRIGDESGEMGDALQALDVGGARVVQLALGSFHSCARFEDGTVKCWGNNAFGQLGLGDTTTRGTAMTDMGSALPTVDLGGAAVDIAAGADHTCALLADGAVKCWGGNTNGKLGLGDSASRGDAPGEMGSALPAVDLDGQRATKLALGKDTTCALLDDGDVTCWGRSEHGQLGQGDTRSRGDRPGQMGAHLPSVPLL